LITSLLSFEDFVAV